MKNITGAAFLNQFQVVHCVQDALQVQDLIKKIHK